MKAVGYHGRVKEEQSVLGERNQERANGWISSGYKVHKQVKWDSVARIRPWRSSPLVVVLINSNVECERGVGRGMTPTPPIAVPQCPQLQPGNF